jgi:hypothetical protein
MALSERQNIKFATLCTEELYKAKKHDDKLTQLSKNQETRKKYQPFPNIYIFQILIYQDIALHYLS